MQDQLSRLFRVMGVIGITLAIVDSPIPFLGGSAAAALVIFLMPRGESQ